MAQTLYNKIRPTTFSGLVGQEAVKKPLVKESTNDRWFRVKMFYGVRGTGKTTIARTVVMAANCTNRLPNGDPCGNCVNCRSILEGTTQDFVELDASSNNSVDDVRGLIEQMSYAPRTLRYRSYIIDEFHMMSTAAFNALLKTLEDLPETALVILCTTEFEKVPETLKSRSQKLEFNRLSTQLISEHLEKVAAAEGIRITSEACAMIARRSDGVMRSALVDLETLADPNDTVTGETVAEAFGITEDQSKFSFLRDFVSLNEAGCISAIAEYERRGKNPATLVNELMEALKDVAIFVNKGKIVASDEYIGKLAAFNEFSLRRLSNASMLLNDMREPLRFDPSIKTFYSVVIKGIRELEKIDKLIAPVPVAVPVQAPAAAKAAPVTAPAAKAEEKTPVMEKKPQEKKPEAYLNELFDDDDDDNEIVMPEMKSATMSQPVAEPSPVIPIEQGFRAVTDDGVPFDPETGEIFQQAPAKKPGLKEKITGALGGWGVKKEAAPVIFEATSDTEEYPSFLKDDTGLTEVTMLKVYNCLKNACKANKALCYTLKQCKAKYSAKGLTLSAPDVMTLSTILMYQGAIFNGDQSMSECLETGVNIL